MRYSASRRKRVFLVEDRVSQAFVRYRVLVAEDEHKTTCAAMHRVKNVLPLLMIRLTILDRAFISSSEIDHSNLFHMPAWNSRERSLIDDFIEVCGRATPCVMTRVYALHTRSSQGRHHG
jgi:hypothetical protein